MKKFVYYPLVFIILFGLACFIAMLWQVDVMKISDDKEQIYYETILPAFVTFDTSYIHSVEQTEVQDTYVVTCGKMWSWEERTKSLKAGMPQQAPRCGRFFMTKDWLVYQGGRISWNKFYYRVGNARLGRNRACFPFAGVKKLYKTIPNRRLIITIKKESSFF